MTFRSRRTRISGSPNRTHPDIARDTKLINEIRSRLEEFGEYDVVHSYLMALIPALAEIGQRTDAATVVTLNAYQGVCAKNDLLYRNAEHCESKSLLKCIDCIGRTGFRDNEHGYLYETGGQLLSLRLVRSADECFDRIDAFRAPSEHVRANYTQFGYDRDKIHVIPHPVDEEFLIDPQRGFTEPYKLLYVGYLVERKGVRKLIPILDSVRDSDFEFELTVVGTGGLESTLRAQAEDRGLRNQVTFAGFVPNGELPAVYAAHDCFVYPGIWEEPLARVYLESLATGTPIVTSEYGTVSEIIGGGGVTTDGSVDDFRRKILDLVRADRFTEVSRRGRQKATEYDLATIIEDLIDVYAEVRSQNTGVGVYASTS
ncbi:glycosyltransferase family 4 protein [Halostagnicola sp. A56]|uniref:glycosyltransferase family 4 protein n=1 Tax=Halostagnicola sp. A56 TaxID=1495067 RepID=UPI0018CF4E4E|nr:glycosyltransferase family 4 protein [Halostagnicola sp. A56]